MTNQSLLATHIAKFNSGVLTGNFQPMTDGFVADAEMRFEGVPVGPWKGRESIRDAYEEHPPLDEIHLLATREEGQSIEADYAWMKEPENKVGMFRITFEEGLITSLLVRFDL